VLLNPGITVSFSPILSRFFPQNRSRQRRFHLALRGWNFVSKRLTRNTVPFWPPRKPVGSGGGIRLTSRLLGYLRSGGGLLVGRLVDFWAWGYLRSGGGLAKENQLHPIFLVTPNQIPGARHNPLKRQRVRDFGPFCCPQYHHEPEFPSIHSESYRQSRLGLLNPGMLLLLP